MAEKCLLAASVAVLICHPKTSIKCFNFKSKPSTTTYHKHKSLVPSSTYDDQNQNQSKSKKKQEEVQESTASTRSKLDIPSSRVSRASKPLNPVSELVQEDLLLRVEGVFRSGWHAKTGLNIEKVIKVKQSFCALNKFEEYREMVKSKTRDGKRKAKLVADGNELLGFHGAIVTCSLGINGVSSVCNKKSCELCRMIVSGSSFAIEEEEKKTVVFYENSWNAHEKVTNECAANRTSARKAIVMCRVIAGRIARYGAYRQLVDGEDGIYDSVMGLTENHPNRAEELAVFNPRAILPCFVVIYNVH